MEIPVRLGRVQSLQEYFQIATSRGNLTETLYDGVCGCCFTVSFPSNARPGGAPLLPAFRNFYTAVLRLVQIHTDGSSSVLLDEYALAQHIHCEDDAQNWHLLHLGKVFFFLCLQAKIDWSRLEAFCVYLSQPPPLWEKRELQDLKFYEAQSNKPAAGASTLSVDPMVAFDANQRGQPSLMKHERPHTAVEVSGMPNALDGMKTDSHNSHADDHRDGHFSRRQSRTALLAYVDSKDVQEHAQSCLCLADRLRDLLHLI